MEYTQGMRRSGNSLRLSGNRVRRHSNTFPSYTRSLVHEPLLQVRSQETSTTPNKINNHSRKIALETEKANLIRKLDENKQKRNSNKISLKSRKIAKNHQMSTRMTQLRKNINTEFQNIANKQLALNELNKTIAQTTRELNSKKKDIANIQRLLNKKEKQLRRTPKNRTLYGRAKAYFKPKPKTY